MFAAATDHVFLDGGHTLDFTNKAFESLAYLGDDAAPSVLPTVVHQTASASRARGARRVAASARPRRAASRAPRRASPRHGRRRRARRGALTDRDVADLGVAPAR